jgi:coenzyme F420-reducing hydrogenase alpha subunit
VSLGVGKFLSPVGEESLRRVRSTALEVKERVSRLIENGGFKRPETRIAFPEEQRLNLLSLSDDCDVRNFRIYDRNGRATDTFDSGEFPEHISEMRGGESFAKFPYLTRLGFPDGILMVGPLARFFAEDGPLADEELKDFELAGHFSDKSGLTLESFDVCRLLEIFWAAKRILELLRDVNLNDVARKVDTSVSGKGIGVVEAPRGVLLHTYLINRGVLEKARLLVATQFNNACINLLLRDIAEKHAHKDGLSEEGEYLIGRCVRLFDPCLSCATH